MEFIKTTLKLNQRYLPRPILAVIFCVLLVFPAPAPSFSQESNSQNSNIPSDVAPSQNHEADIIALRELKTIVENAMSNDDQIHTLEPFVAKDFSIVTFTSRQFDDFDVFNREWNKSRKKFLQGGEFAVSIDPEPTIFCGDIAICRGNSTNTITIGNGTRHVFSSPWSATCRKENGVWKLVRAHSSIDPFSNPVLNSNIRWYLWLVGIIATVVGVLLGYFVAFAFTNRKYRAKPDLP